MLEQTSLLLGPWRGCPSGEAGARVRAVADASGKTLGHVREAPQTGPRWLRWLGRRTLEICESPDASLVFSLRRAWGWPAGWQLIDADGRLVGALRGRAMVDGFGQLLALVEQPDTGNRGKFLAIEGHALGEYSLGNDGPRITFGPEMDGNPFAKMMLLGAILVLA